MSFAQKKYSPSGKSFLPARVAAQKLACAQDYVGKLCRDGKLDCARVDGAWLVEEDSISAFEKSRKTAKVSRAQELSLLRHEENTLRRKMLSTKHAARMLGCAPDYIGKLCREGKLEGVRVKSAWFVSAESLADFETQRDWQRALRAQELSDLRRSEIAEYQSVDEAVEALPAPVRPVQKRSAPQENPLFKGAAFSFGVVLLFASVLFAADSFSGRTAVGQHVRTAVFGQTPAEQAAALAQLESPFFGVHPTAITFTSGGSERPSFFARLVAFLFEPAEPQYAALPEPQVKPAEPNSTPAVAQTTINNTTNNYTTNNTNHVTNNTYNNSSYTIAGAAQDGSLVTKDFFDKSVERIFDVIARSNDGGGITEITDADVPDDITASNYLALSGGTLTGALNNTATATSTFAGGLALTGGCISLNGACIGDGVPGGSDGQIQFNNGGAFGGSSNLTFDSGTGLLGFAYASGTAATTTSFFSSTSSSTNLFTSNFSIGSLTGLLQANNGLVTASSTLSVQFGGTGTSSAPTYGQLLVGDGVGGYAFFATSSLGITPLWGNIGGNLSDQTDLQTALDSKLSLAAWFATTTDVLDEGSTNQYFTTSRARQSISGSGVIAYDDTTGVISTQGGTFGSGSYIFPSNITVNGNSQVGTVTSGIWNGSAIGSTYGGTGITSITQSQLLIGGGGNAWTQVGTSSLGIALADTTGTLSVARGGTGATTLSGLLLGNGTSAITGTTLSADLSGALSDETGSGALVFSANAQLSSTTLLANTLLTYATSTALNTGLLGVGGSQYFTSLLGTGLTNTSGALGVTLSPFSTTNLSEGSNLYYTDARVGSYISGSSTIPHVGGSAYGDILQWSGSAWATAATSALGVALGDTTGTLDATRGGTGLSSFITGDILYADSNSTLTRLPVGSAGQVLKVQAGLPAWGVDQTVGGGGNDGIFATSSGKIYPLDTSNVLLIGTDATSTANSIFEVSGQQYISTRLAIATTSPSTGAALAVSGAGYFTGGLGVGVLNTVAGTLRTSGNATIGGALTLGSALGVQYGGTGSTTLSGLLVGNGTGSLLTATVSGPLAFSGSTLSITQSSGSTSGYLSSTDWTLFNNKVSSSSLAQIFPFTPTTFGSAANATSTLIGFNSGIYALASSTIGGGTQTTGLTISGGATTTGNAYVGGNLTVAGSATVGQLASDNYYGQGDFFEFNADGTGSILFKTNGIERFAIYSSGANEGNVGLGTSSPGQKLSVAGDILGNRIIGSNFISTSTMASTFAGAITSTATAKNTFPYASSTALTVSGTGYFGTASTSNLTISSLASGSLLKTTTAGVVTTAVAGTDYATPSQISAAFPFTPTTFGSTAANATSTLIGFNSGIYALASSTIGGGTQTTGLTISGGATTTGNAYVGGTGRFGSTLTLASVASCTGNQALQTNASGDIACGSISISGASTGGGWTTNNVGSVTLATTSDRVGIGATSTPYAKLSVLSGAAGTTTLALLPFTGQTANILDIYNTSGALSSVFTASGRLGLGTTSPSQVLSVEGGASIFGNVGIGTTSPYSKLSVVGGNITHVAAGAPTLAASTSTIDVSYLSYVSGNYAYVADNGGGLKIIDITNPKSPVTAGIYSAVTTVRSVAVAGKYAYVGDSDTGLKILDVSNPSSPTLVGTYAAGGRAFTMALAGRYVFLPDVLTGTLRIVDVANPVNPTLAGSYSTGGLGEPYAIAVSGKYAYLGDQGNGDIYVLDISNIANPTLVSTYSTGVTAPTNIYLSGKYAYVSDAGGGFYILDTSNPAALTLVGSYSTSASYYGVQVAGGYAYLANNTSGTVVVLDVSNISTPTLVGTYSGATAPRGIVIAGKYVYVADLSGGLKILDINGIQAPAATIGAIQTNVLNVTDSVNIGGDIYAGGGLNVGLSGIFSRGGLASFGSSTLATTTVSSLTVGGLSGVLQATNGIVSATSTLSVGFGGTGSTTLSGLLVGNGTGSLLTATVSGPLAFSGSTLSISQANGSTNGYLSSTDWTLFNNKISSSSLAQIFPFTPTTFGSTAANATSTLIGFNSGIYALASSTIGGGTDISGLTISGGATTTGTAYFGNSIYLTKDGNNQVGFISTTSRASFGGNYGTTVYGAYMQMMGANYNGGSSITSKGGAEFVIDSRNNTTQFNVLTYNGTNWSQPMFTVLSSGEVGIGSSTPYAKLSVKGAGTGTGVTFQTTNSNNVPLVTMLDNGNVGIGTTSPGQKLSVAGDILGNRIIGSYFTSTSTTASTFAGVITSTATAANTFPYASTTALTVSGTTYMTSLANSVLATDPTGKIIATTSIGVNNISGILPVANGGTGSTTLSGLLVGNGTDSLLTATVSGPLAFSGSTLSISQANGSTNGYLSSTDWTLFNNKVSSSSLATQIASAFPFTAQTWGNSTSTLIGFNNGILVNAASSTITGALNITGAITSTATTPNTLPYASTTALTVSDKLFVGTHGVYTNPASSSIIGAPALGTGLDSFNWVSEFRATAGNINRLMIGTHRTAAGSDWTTSAWRIQPAVDNSFTGTASHRGYLEFAHGSAGSYSGIGLNGSGAVTPNVVINTSGNVGIGTTTPAATLQVNASATTDVSLTFGASAGQIFRNENSELAIGLENTSPYALYLQGRTNLNAARDIAINPLGGSIGVGTSSPQSALNVDGSSPTIQVNASGASGARFGAVNPFGSWYMGTGSDGNFYVNTTTSLSTSPGFSILSSSGNVGIGTASPASKLEVSGGNIEVSGSVSPSIIFDATSGSDYVFGSNTGAVGAGIYDSTASAWRLLVKDTTGNVGIGTTSPGQKLSVAGDILGNNIIGSYFTSTSTTASTFAGNIDANAGLDVAGADITAATGVQVDFADEIGDKLNLYTTTYGIGISSGETNWWSGGVWSWRTSSRTGTEVMNLSAAGNLQLDGALTVSGTAASTFAGAITSTATAANTFPYASTTALSVSGNAYFPGSGIWNSSGNVGIGTTTPSVRLHLYGTSPVVHFTDSNASADEQTWSINGNAGSLAFQGINDAGSGGGDYVAFTRSGNSMLGLTFYDNAAAKNFISNAGDSYFTSGNVGIGTTSPQEKLVVNGGQLFVNNGTTETTARSVGIGVAYNPSAQYTPGTDPTDAGRGLTVYSDTATRASILTLRTVGAPFWDMVATASSTLNNALHFNAYNGGAYNTRLTITEPGNVGIGTTSPGQKLSVAGDILGNRIIGSYFTSTSTTASTFAGAITSTATAANTFPYASTTALSVGGNAYFGGTAISGAQLSLHSNSSSNGQIALSFIDNEAEANLSSLATSFGGGMSFNMSGGQGDFDFINRYDSANSGVQGFRFYQQTGTGTFTNWLTLSGDTGALTSAATAANTFPYASSTAISVSGTGYFGTANVSGLTASRLVATDANKNLVSTVTLANLASSISDVTGTTGTGNLVLSASPTFTGTTNFANISVSGNSTLGTVTSGIWNGSAIGGTYGGTGLTSVTQNSLLIGAAGNTWTQVATSSLGIALADTTGTLTVAKGGTGATTLTDGGVLLGSGTGAVTAMAVLGNGAIIVGDGTTDPVALTAFTSSTGDLIHEAGGLEADISGYSNGLYGMLSGVTADIDTESELETALGALDLVSVTADDITAAQLLSIVNGDTGTGNLVFSAAPTLTGALTGGTSVWTSSVTSTYPVRATAASLGTSLNDSTNLLSLTNGNGNVNYLNIQQIRNTAGANWTTATTRIQQVTDVTNQGYIDFNPLNGTYGLAFGSQGTEYMRLANGGNVGIGTTSPGSLLSLGGVANFTAATSTFYGTGGLNLAGGCYAINSTCLTVNNVGGTLSIANGGTNATTQTTNGVNYFNGTSITSGTDFNYNGTNVGIGSTSPSKKLTVLGSSVSSAIGQAPVRIGVTTASSVGLELGTYGGGFAMLQGLQHTTNAAGMVLLNPFGGSVGVGTTTSSSYTFSVTGTNYVTGNAIFGGNVGIGTASPSSALDIVSSSAAGNQPFLTIQNTSGANTGTFGPGIILKNGVAGTHGFILQQYQTTASTFSISNNVSPFTSYLTIDQAGKTTIGNNLVVSTTTATSTFSTGGLTVGTSQFVVQQTSGNVGIGTVSPVSKLDVLANGAVFGDQTANRSTDATHALNVIANTDSTLRLLRGNVGAIDFSVSGTAGVPRLGITGGNVGIGTTTPQSKLHVEGSNAAGTLTLSSSDTSVGAGEELGRLNFFSNDISTNGGGIKSYIASVEDDGGIGRAYDLTFGTSNGTTLSEKLRIDNSGNVGIGTTSPMSALAVESTGATALTVKSASGQTAGINFYRSTANSARLEVDTTNNLSFFTNNTGNTALTERMVITNGGNVGIGTTTPLTTLEIAGTAGAPSLTATNEIFQLSRANVGNTQALAIGIESASPYGVWLQAKRRQNDGNSFPLLLNPVGGNVGIGTTTPAAKLNVFDSGNNAAVMQIDTPGTQASQQAALQLVTKSSAANLGAASNLGWQITGRGNAYTTAAEQNDLKFYYWNGSTYNNALTIDSLTGNTTLTYASTTQLSVSGNTYFPGSGIWNSSGNVGIGTTSPQMDLAVGGRVHIDYNTSTWDVWIQGGYGSGDSRNIALLGSEVNDDLILNYNGEYDCVSVGGTVCTEMLDVTGDGSFTGSLTAGAANFSGALTATTLDTGNGANELYAMNQNVQITDSPTFATLNIGGSGTYAAGSIYSDANWGMLLRSKSAGAAQAFSVHNSVDTALFNISNAGTVNIPGNLTVSTTTTSTFAGAITSTATSKNTFPYASSTALTVSNYAFFQGTTTIGFDLGAKLNNYSQANGTSGTSIGTSLRQDSIPTSASTLTNVTLRAEAQHHANATVGIDALTAIQSIIYNGDTSTVGTSKGLDILLTANAGTLTNTYGLYVGDLTTGTQTNTPYSVYASDAGTYNYFAGNVGIGTTTPNSLLTLQAANGSAVLRVNAANASGDAKISLNDSGGNEYTIGRDTTTGFLDFSGTQTTYSGYKWRVNNGTEVMRITNGGLVGVGTTTPSAPLTVYEASGSSYLDIVTPGTGTSDQTSLDFLTRAGAAGATIGNSTVLGWTMYGRGNAYTTAAQQNDFGLAYWNGSTYISPLQIDSLTGQTTLTYASTTQLSVSGASYFTGTMTGGAANFSGAITATTLNTGNGAYELYAMNQNVQMTDSPTFANVVLSGAAAAHTIEMGATDSSQYAYIDLKGDTTYTDFGLRLLRGNTGANAASQLVHRGTGQLQILTVDAGSLGLGTNNGIDMTIDTSGNVGIGTASPASKLEVSGGNIEVSGLTSPSIIFDATSGSDYVFGSNTSAVGAGIYDSTASLWRLLVKDTTGNVGIGTTTPGQKLSVAGDILGNNIIGSYFTGTSTTASTLAGGLTVSGNTTLALTTIDKDSSSASGSTILLTVSGDQTVASTGNLYGASIAPRYTAASGNTLAALYGAQFNPQNTSTGDITSMYGVYAVGQNTGGGTVGTLRGVWAVPSNSSGTVTSLMGMQSTPSTSGTAITTTQYGVFANPQLTGSGAITTHFGMYADPAVGTAGSGTITNQYGLYVRGGNNSSAGGVATNYYQLYLENPLTAGTITNPVYGIYQRYTSAYNYFGGNVGLNVTSPYRVLTVAATTTDATYGSQISLQSASAAIDPGELIGGIEFRSNDNNITAPGLVVAQIAAVSAGIHNASNQLTDLMFTTTATGGAATSTEKMRITGAGFLGIGTSTPNAMLTVGSAASGGNVRVGNGWLCVDNNDTCTGATTAGTVYAVGAYTTGADLAEQYPTLDDTLVPGEIVSFDVYNNIHVVRAAGEASFLGVISTAPGVLLNGYKGDVGLGSSTVPVALAGRVPVKVSLEGGSIAIGDRLMLSSTPGVAKKATESGQTIGVALEPYTSSATSSAVLVFIDPQYTFAQNVLEVLHAIAAASEATSTDSGAGGGATTTSTSTAQIFTSIILEALAQLGVTLENGIARFMDIFADHITTNTLTVGSTERPAGITLFDKVTGAPYCLEVVDGDARTTPGECVVGEGAPAPEPEPTPEAGGSEQNIDTASSTSTTSATSTSETSTGSGGASVVDESTADVAPADTGTDAGTSADAPAGDTAGTADTSTADTGATDASTSAGTTDSGSSASTDSSTTASTADTGSTSDTSSTDSSASASDSSSSSESSSGSDTSSGSDSSTSSSSDSSSGSADSSGSSSDSSTSSAPASE